MTHIVSSAAGGLVVLLVITAISVVKPWGRTGFERRIVQREQNQTDDSLKPSEIPEYVRRSRGFFMSIPSLIFGPAHRRIIHELPVELKVLHAIIGIGILVMVLHLTGHGHGIHG